MAARHFTLVSTLLTVACLGPSRLAAQIFKLSDSVVVIAGGPITNRHGDKIGEVSPGTVFSVPGEAGDFILVGLRGLPKLASADVGFITKSIVIVVDKSAIDRLTKMIKAAPADANLYMGRGLSYLKLRDPDNAIADFDQAVELSPERSDLYESRASAWRAKKDYDKAIADYRTTMRLAPEKFQLYILIGYAWEEKNDLQEAIASFDEVLKRDPRNSVAFHVRGAAFEMKRDFDQAIQNYSKLIDGLGQKSPTSLARRGEAWLAKGEFDKALEDFDEAVRKAPTLFSTCRYDRAIARLLQRNPSAIDDFQAAIDINQKRSKEHVATPSGPNQFGSDDRPVILGHMAAWLLGDGTRAKRFLEVENATEEWPHPAVRFLRGEIDEPALLAAADTNRKQIDAHCYLGFNDVVHAKLDEARRQFRWVLDNRWSLAMDYAIAREELNRMGERVDKP